MRKPTITSLCKQMNSLTDEDFDVMDEIIKGQETYTHPLKGATAQRQNKLGAYNRKVFNKLKELRQLFNQYNKL